jgi:choline dehydrogenase
MKKKDVDSWNNSPQLDKLEALVLSGKLSRRRFIHFSASLGITAVAAATMADKALAVSTVQADLKRNLRSHYDYIVCGAGAAGSAVARRLAENPAVQVLLLEAGGSDDAPSIINPSLWPTNIGSQYDWGFKTVPHRALNNRSIPMPMGKALGGGSSINASIWAHGHKNDYDFWAKEANDSAWDYENVLAIYRRIEDWQGEPDPTHRGNGGLVYVGPASNPSPLAPAFVQGAASIGIPSFPDHNGAMMERVGGAAIANLCVKDGRRRNMPSNYLYPYMDKGNLTILTKAQVNRLTLVGTKVTGVEVEWGGKVHKLSSDREVVLSTGAINTPRILMLSGIGNAADLEQLGIKPVSNLPGVGQNFQDHMLVAACMWEPNEPIPPRNNAAEATFFWKSDARIETPDLQPFLIEVPFLSDVNMPQAIPSGWVITPGIVKPKSRGYVRLLSNEPNGQMEIHANALEHPDDVTVLRKGVELCRELGNSDAMKPFVKREVMPRAIKGNDLETFVRNSAVSYNHATCTAKMGTDNMSVVDSQLRVYGIQGLRIADGSIMPRITTGNTMAPSVIIGERLAEILRA